MARRGGDEEGGMPATGAGLMRYFDEDTRGPKLDPKFVIGMCIVVIIFEMLLHGGLIV